MKTHICFYLALFAFCLPPSAFGEDVQRPRLPDAPERVAQGFALTIEAIHSSGAQRVTHRCSARMAAWYVQRSELSPFFASLRLRAMWEGDLKVPLRDEYIFSADGRGKLSLEINGQMILTSEGEDLSTTESKPVELKKGANHLVIQYDSPDTGDARMRLYWKGGEFGREPLPTRDISHNANALPLRDDRALREGRELYAELRCQRCHAGDSPLPVGKGAVEGDRRTALPLMPELAIDAPSLAAADKRLYGEWMTAWIADPHALRPDATMPKLLRSGGATQDAADIAAYLATLGGVDDSKPIEPPSSEQISAGGVVFSTLGCIGCHTLPDHEGAAPGRVPLRHVRKKYQPQALREFLKQPDKHYAWIRMPNFHLSDEEIEQLSAFILHQPLTTEHELFILKNKLDTQHGKQLFETSGCLNCHDAGPGYTNLFKTIAMKDIPAAGWSRGCMAAEEKDRGNAPDFGLNSEQRTALLTFAALGHSPRRSQVEALPEFTERRIAALRCMACHRRDDQEDVWSNVEDEVEKLKPAQNNEEQPVQGMVEQIRPSLTWAGEKLKPEWMADFIAGRIKDKPRPWLHARMPSFPALQAELIAKGLCLEHGMPPVSPPDPKPDPELSEIGRKLIGKNGGFGCTECHAIGAQAAVAVFEAPGPNFASVKARLTKNYFHRWMNEPLRVEPGTKMPQKATDGKTALTEFFGGDAHKQFEAIWQYLQNGEAITPPEP